MTIKSSSQRFAWQHQLVLRGVMFTGAILTTLVPLATSSALATFKDSPKAIVDEVWQIVNRDYVDGTFNHVDWQKTRTQLLQQKYHNRQEAYAAIRSSLKKLGDRYTRFMNPEEFQSLTNQTSGEVAGVGLKMDADPRTHKLVVVGTVAKSPAANAGILPGDTIVAIDGKYLKNLSIVKTVDRQGTNEDFSAIQTTIASECILAATTSLPLTSYQ